ncbi:FAD-dependent oxidoreductase [Hydrogenophaga crassostreae]|uniref:FAD-dependent oxidoreductase n=1 Tax=Hydrogenophaga crassostreae TaxID=1763535 RepID=A0A162PCS6_9BURK|nr:FAD-dependent monooxygenase [Hydrogenophaga crassostreae]AOW15734.1 FAD-dependent oxidoreductase [Hydrogenophaga crassostreae]OAD43828.1 FAD-dependent oxidoreductase [Hydrogenophaga crassostreae]
MTEQVVVAGGGIGGLGAALALSREGVAVDLLEQASAFGEVGAGLQLGPNAVRVLDAWGLLGALKGVAAFPEALRVRDVSKGTALGALTLGFEARQRYGQVYATVHRADLHGLLLEAVERQSGVRLRLNQRVASYVEGGSGIRVTDEDGSLFEGQALLGCDGLWSRVRSQMLGAQPVRSSGHLAYRGLVRTGDLPPSLRACVVTAWLGPRLHAVHYPVRRGDWFNVVVVVQGVIGQGHGGEVGSDPQSWTHEAHAADLRRTLGPVSSDLLAVVDAVGDWKLWPLNDRAPMAGAREHAQGRVALLGDAAHPLRPYLAQGAAMALEDAWTMGQLVGEANSQPVNWPELLQRFARTRWQRNARVQSRSARNGTIFHAEGPLRWSRNAAMWALGETLLDNPWLYEGPPAPVA